MDDDFKQVAPGMFQQYTQQVRLPPSHYAHGHNDIRQYRNRIVTRKPN